MHPGDVIYVKYILKNGYHLLPPTYNMDCLVWPLGPSWRSAALFTRLLLNELPNTEGSTCRAAPGLRRADVALALSQQVWKMPRPR